MGESLFRSLSYLRLGISTAGVVLLLLAVKYGIFYFGYEQFPLNPLYASALSGAVFIMGFLLAGVLGDYREAERAPAELRSALESIWEDARAGAVVYSGFDAEPVRTKLIEIIQHIFNGLSYDRRTEELQDALDSLDQLSASFIAMERAGMPANHVVRLKAERAVARRLLLRMHHMQRTQFVPSVYFLAQSIVGIIIVILLFVESNGAPELFALFAFFSYIFIFIHRLIPVLEQPFHQGFSTKDDVSLFLLHDFEAVLQRADPRTTS